MVRPNAVWSGEPGGGAVKYAIIIEKTDNGYSGYVPDLPGCVSAGDSVEETETLLREAVPFHVELLRQYGEPVPEPQTSIALIDVQTAPASPGAGAG